MKIALVNSYYLPDRAITGVSLSELAMQLDNQENFEVKVFSTNSTYINEQGKNKNCKIDIIRLGRIHKNSGPFTRLLTSLFVGKKLAKEAVSWADVVVTMSDPPLLNYWVGKRIKRSNKNVRWIDWTMDLYPEAFVAALPSFAKNPLYRYFINSLKKNSPDALICLGLHQLKMIQKSRGIYCTHFILPCGVIESTQQKKVPKWREKEKRIVLAYAGNVGNAHSYDLLRRIPELIDPTKFHLRYALTGKHSQALKSHLSHHKNITWLDRMDHDDLKAADVNIVSLLPKWNHVCVPSKAVSGICLGRPLIYAGQRDNDNLTMLGSAVWEIPIDEKGNCLDEDLLKVLNEIEDDKIRSKKTKKAKELSIKLASHNSHTYKQIIEWIRHGNK